MRRLRVRKVLGCSAVAGVAVTAVATPAGATEPAPGPYAPVVASWPSELIQTGPNEYVSNKPLRELSFSGTALVGPGCSGYVIPLMRNPGPNHELGGMISSGDPGNDWYGPPGFPVTGGTWSTPSPWILSYAYQDGTYDIAFAQYCNDTYYGTLFHYTLDRQVAPPVVSIDVSCTATSTTVSGTGEPGATLHLTADPWGDDVTAVVDADGSWSVDYPHPFPAGTTTVTAHQVDRATNVSETTTTTVDHDVPCVGSTEGPTDGPTEGPTGGPTSTPTGTPMPPSITTGYAEDMPERATSGERGDGRALAAVIGLTGVALAGFGLRRRPPTRRTR